MKPWKDYSPNPSVPWNTGMVTPQVQETPQPQISDFALEMRPHHPFGALRRAANAQAGALLIYHVIMNVVIMVVTFAVSFGLAFSGALENETVDVETVTQITMESAGWGYVIAVAIGFLALLVWKKPGYLRHTILQKGKSIGIGGFFTFLSIMMSAQMVAQICNLGLEGLMNAFGLDGASLEQLGNVDTDSFGMFLYIGILAPISEELLFRGLVLRSIEPYGKKMAVIGSAILFGLYHGNLVQTPYAIMVGLVLGYVAMEYHVIWAIAMHMFNNLVFAMLLPKVLAFLPIPIIDGILWALTIGFFVAAVLILIAKHAEAIAVWKQETVQNWQRRAFFRAPAVIVLIVVCLINIVATTLLLFM